MSETMSREEVLRLEVAAEIFALSGGYLHARQAERLYQRNARLAEYKASSVYRDKQRWYDRARHAANKKIVLRMARCERCRKEFPITARRQQSGNALRFCRPGCQNGKWVVCVETGERFPSCSAAARSIGASITAVSHAVRTGQRCRGRRWRFAEAQP